MAKDCECPFCQESFDIDEPMGDDDTVEMDCPHCEREVTVTASVHVSYKASCGPTGHDLVPSERHTGWENCTRCDLFRKVAP